jgi:hypothetical protein
LRGPGTSVSSYVQTSGVSFYKEGRKGILQETPLSFFRNFEVGLQLQNSFENWRSETSVKDKRDRRSLVTPHILYRCQFQRSGFKARNSLKDSLPLAELKIKLTPPF